MAYFSQEQQKCKLDFRASLISECWSNFCALLQEENELQSRLDAQSGALARLEQLIEENQQSNSALWEEQEARSVHFGLL